jgi:hypothetical protein
MAGWVLDPASAQVSSEAVPEELRIIEDLPDAVEAGREHLERQGRLDDDAEGDALAPESPSSLEGTGGSLFDENHSLLFAPPEGTPAERLLPDERDVPDVTLDPRSPDRDDTPARAEADEVLTGEPTAPDGTVDPLAPVRGRTDGGPSGAGRRSGGATSGGSGSLF